MYAHKTIIGTGSPLVLIHGWGFNSGVWSDFAIQLSKHHQVIMIDLPGYGKSDALSNANTLDALVNGLLPHLPSNADYIGWSLGGLISLYIKLHYPESVGRVINLASTPCFSQKENWPGLTATQLHELANNIQDNKHIALTYFTWWQTNKDKIIFKKMKSLIDDTASSKTLLQGLDILRNTDLRYEQSQLTDIIYLNGNKDPIIPNAPFQNSDIINGASHVPFITHPNEVIRNV